MLSIWFDLVGFGWVTFVWFGLVGLIWFGLIWMLRRPAGGVTDGVGGGSPGGKWRCSQLSTPLCSPVPLALCLCAENIG